MNLLDLITGHTYKKASSHNGGEYHGPCPACGGTDRFHIWPQQGDHGTFWCRACGLAGDAIEYLMKIDGKTFPDACRQLGKDVPEAPDYQAPRFKKPAAADTFTPRETVAPAGLWLQHAEKLVTWAHEQLLSNPLQLSWCAQRGLDLDAVKKYRLGWNPGEKGKDLYRVRESWGLESAFKPDGTTKKKLWLPIGLVIPCYQGEKLHRIRIRRPEGEPRYYLVPGSGTAPMILGENARAFVIVESELDAILVHHLAGDLVGAISQGNSTAKPDTFADYVLKNALAILIALDADDAGMRASVWWRQQYPQAERHPVPVGKDPGDAYKAGCSIRDWVKIGLPPVLTLPRIAPETRPAPAPPAPPVAPAPAPPAAPTVFPLVTADGQAFYVTNDPQAYLRLCAEGQIAFTNTEIDIIRRAGFTKEQNARIFELKKTLGPVFGAAAIETIIPEIKQSEETA
ncbi:MAG: alpha helicase [Desulfobulbaceae bacterium]|nr:alpha helicase [Desulfobulbaceae bacterium]